MISVCVGQGFYVHAARSIRNRSFSGVSCGVLTRMISSKTVMEKCAGNIWNGKIRRSLSFGRNVFEEKSGLKSVWNRSVMTTAASAEAVTKAAETIPRSVPIWLYGCCGLVFGTVVVGGITRLTESGLSMTKWHPIKGIVPPLNQKEWEDEFAHYQMFPEYEV